MSPALIRVSRKLFQTRGMLCGCGCDFGPSFRVRTRTGDETQTPVFGQSPSRCFVGPATAGWPLALESSFADDHPASHVFSPPPSRPSSVQAIETVRGPQEKGTCQRSTCRVRERDPGKVQQENGNLSPCRSAVRPSNRETLPRKPSNPHGSHTVIPSRSPARKAHTSLGWHREERG